MRSSHPPSDPLIDEVRSIRAAISARYGHDLDKLFAHVKRAERNYERASKRRAVTRERTPN